MADKLAGFRKNLDDKVSKAEVRSVVEDVLTKLRDRVAKLDARISGLEGRAGKLEDRFADLEKRLGVALPHQSPERKAERGWVFVLCPPWCRTVSSLCHRH